jgi:peptidoglycan/LPS O-acetylase OafA/YrhL
LKSKSGEIKPLTGMRGVAAVLVVAHHAESAALLDRGDVFFRGQPWVDLFFVLSGYVMALRYLEAEKVDFRTFYVHRVARIYPLHILTAFAMMAAACVLTFLHHQPLPERLNLVQALRELTLTMALPVVGSHDIWNYPAWSISVEWWVYFTVFPILAVVGRRLAGMFWLLIGLLGMAALGFWLLTLPLDYGVTRGWSAFLRAVAGFVAGYGVRRVEKAMPSLRVPPLMLDFIVIAIVAIIYLTPPLIGRRDFWPVMLLFPVVVFGCIDTDCLTSRFLSWRPIKYLGDISYTIYLVHALIIAVWHATATQLHIETPWLAVPVCMAASVLAASWLWPRFERPAATFVRRRLERNTT